MIARSAYAPLHANALHGAAYQSEPSVRQPICDLVSGAVEEEELRPESADLGNKVDFGYEVNSRPLNIDPSLRGCFQNTLLVASGDALKSIERVVFEWIVPRDFKIVDAVGRSCY